MLGPSQTRNLGVIFLPDIPPKCLYVKGKKIMLDLNRDLIVLRREK